MPIQVRLADSEKEQVETKIFVGMLPKLITSEDLRALFSEFGEIEDAVVLTSQSSESKGFFFVTCWFCLVMFLFLLPCVAFMMITMLRMWFCSFYVSRFGISSHSRPKWV
jgi:RNA recognition motif-containing protein